MNTIRRAIYLDDPVMFIDAYNEEMFGDSQPGVRSVYDWDSWIQSAINVQSWNVIDEMLRIPDISSSISSQSNALLVGYGRATIPNLDVTSVADLLASLDGDTKAIERFLVSLYKSGDLSDDLISAIVYHFRDESDENGIMMDLVDILPALVSNPDMFDEETRELLQLDE